jgi:soluble lytic murein transglycosylase-like protein
MRGKGELLLGMLIVGLVVPATAEVRVEIRANGQKVILNEPAESRSRRLSDRLLSPGDEEIENLIVTAALDYDLDPRLVQAVMQVESGFNPTALSNKGAMGLMQLMPQTAQILQVSDPWDPEQNVRGGVKYLKQMLDRFRDLELALAAYNAGPEAVERHGGIPPFQETQQYVRKVLKLYDGMEPREGRRVVIRRDAQNRLWLVTAGSGG